MFFCCVSGRKAKTRDEFLGAATGTVGACFFIVKSFGVIYLSNWWTMQPTRTPKTSILYLVLSCCRSREFITVSSRILPSATERSRGQGRQTIRAMPADKVIPCATHPHVNVHLNIYKNQCLSPSIYRTTLGHVEATIFSANAVHRARQSCTEVP